MYKEDGGLFGVAMGFDKCKFSVDKLELIVAMQDAEDEFEQQMKKIVNNVSCTNKAEEVLASLIKSWQSVIRTRTMAGFL